MVSISVTINTLLSVGIACVCLITVETRPAETQEKLRGMIRSFLQDNNEQSLDGLSKESHLTNSPGNENIAPYISKLKSEVQKMRVKRLGIAGHENIDMILNHLRKPNTIQRFRPALSLGGSFANLRNLMSKAGR